MESYARLVGTLIAADMLCYIRASLTYAPRYLPLHHFDDYMIILQAHEGGLAVAVLDSRPEDTRNWFVIYYYLSNIQPPP